VVTDMLVKDFNTRLVVMQVHEASLYLVKGRRKGLVGEWTTEYLSKV
jgi:hypothetical protein